MAAVSEEIDQHVLRYVASFNSSTPDTPLCFFIFQVLSSFLSFFITKYLIPPESFVLQKIRYWPQAWKGCLWYRLEGDCEEDPPNCSPEEDLRCLPKCRRFSE